MAIVLTSKRIAGEKGASPWPIYVPTKTPEYLAFRKCYEYAVGVVTRDPDSFCDDL